MTINTPLAHVVRCAVFVNRANVVKMLVQDYDPQTGIAVDMDWTNVHHMVVTLVDRLATDAYVFDSQVALGVVNFVTNGLLVFKLGDLSISKGSYAMRVTIFDFAGLRFELLHETMPGQRVMVDVLPTTVGV